MAGHLVSSSNMDLDDEIPVFILHVLEADVPQDPSVVQEHINSAKLFDGSFDDLLPIFNAVVISDGFASSCSDFFDDYVCGLRGKSVSLIFSLLQDVSRLMNTPSMKFPLL